MKPILPIVVALLVSFLESCGECQPDLELWKTERQKMRSVIDLYQADQLLFGSNHARVERIVPDGIRIIDFDTLIYTNVGSRTNLNDGTFTVRFYKLDQYGKKIQQALRAKLYSVNSIYSRDGTLPSTVPLVAIKPKLTLNE